MSKQVTDPISGYLSVSYYGSIFQCVIRKNSAYPGRSVERIGSKSANTCSTNPYSMEVLHQQTYKHGMLLWVRFRFTKRPMLCCIRKSPFLALMFRWHCWGWNSQQVCPAYRVCHKADTDSRRSACPDAALLLVSAINFDKRNCMQVRAQS